METPTYALDRAAYNQGRNAQFDIGISDEDRAQTLVAKGPGAVAVPHQHRYTVRRLTPTECARLQGFPDWWAAIPTIEDMTDDQYTFWCDVLLTQAIISETARWDDRAECYVVWQEIKPDKKKGEHFDPYWRDTGKAYKPATKKQMIRWYNKLHTDSAEYKMWGNGVALPVVRIPIHGMAQLGAKTLGSLFDGSGGFPLAALLDGIETLWASEVEPYPIAVTEWNFGGKAQMLLGNIPNTFSDAKEISSQPASFVLRMHEGCAGGGKGPLIQTEKSGTLATNNDQYLFTPSNTCDGGVSGE